MAAKTATKASSGKLHLKWVRSAIQSPVKHKLVVKGLGFTRLNQVIERPDHDLTIRDVLRIYAFDRQEVGRLLAIPRMSESWRRWAEQYLQEAKGRAAETTAPGCSQVSAT
jgi:ribosomal protein L30/L7E